MTIVSDPVANEYGPVFAAYRGHGKLRGKNEDEAPCTFSAFQLRDGKVIVLTKVTNFENHWVSTINAVDSLTGTTAAGQALSARGLLETSYLPSLTHEEAGIYGAYHCRELIVRSADASGVAPHSSRFELTNLTLETARRLTIVHPSATGHVQILDEHRDRIKRLKALRTIDVTAALVIREPELSEHHLVADDVCRVLSLACGTTVQWIARTDCSKSGTVLQQYHGSHVTKPLCPLPLIDPRVEEDIPRFVEVALPAYVTRKSKWDLARCILAFLDARAEADFLETRGVKLAVVMEMLKNSLLTAENVAEFVRPEPEFAELRPALKNAIGAVFSQHGWQESERAIAYANLQSLNRVPFYDHLTALCERLELSLSPADLQLFVRCRNSLVHRGRFYCQTADDDARRNCQPHASPPAEYFWLLHVMDRLFLRLVDYRGPLIDWSEVGAPKRRDSF